MLTYDSFFKLKIIHGEFLCCVCVANHCIGYYVVVCTRPSNALHYALNYAIKLDYII